MSQEKANKFIKDSDTFLLNMEEIELEKYRKILLLCSEFINNKENQVFSCSCAYQKAIADSENALAGIKICLKQIEHHKNNIHQNKV